MWPAVVTTDCPHHRLHCHHDHLVQVRREDGISFEHRGPCRDPHRHRTARAVARRDHHRLHRRRRTPSGGRSAAPPRPPLSTAPRPAHPARQRGHPQGRIRPLHAPAGRRGLARPRTPTASRPRRYEEEREHARADPGRHRRAETPRPDRRRRAAGAKPPWRPGTPPRQCSMGTWRSSGPSGTPRPATWSPATSPPWPTPPQASPTTLQVPDPGPGRGSHPRRRPCPSWNCAPA